jgi:hypothetical protein
MWKVYLVPLMSVAIVLAEANTGTRYWRKLRGLAMYTVWLQQNISGEDYRSRNSSGHAMLINLHLYKYVKDNTFLKVWILQTIKICIAWPDALLLWLVLPLQNMIHCYNSGRQIFTIAITLLRIQASPDHYACKNVHWCISEFLASSSLSLIFVGFFGVFFWRGGGNFAVGS